MKVNIDSIGRRFAVVKKRLTMKRRENTGNPTHGVLTWC